VSRIVVSVDIDAAPDVVWAVLEPIEDHVQWMRDAIAIRFETDQHRGPGTRFVCTTKVGPITLADRMQVTSWEPGQRMGVEHSGIVTGRGEFTLTPIDLGRRTRFTWTEDLHFPLTLGGAVGEAVGGRFVMRAIWRRNLRALATLVERHQAAAS
jgi:uncharacterized protein YndB with AHSA1/START domain